MKYAGVINNDVVNGYDVCVSYWCQGCRFRCHGCHNPQTWDFDGGKDINEDELIKNIISAISKNGIQRNLSILGGEPMCKENRLFTAKLIRSVIKEHPSIKIFLWTGYVFESLYYHMTHNESIDFILRNIHVMIDGRFDINYRNIALPFRGSENQRVINVPETLKNKRMILYKQN